MLLQPLHRLNSLLADFFHVNIGRRRNVGMTKNLLDRLEIDAQAFEVRPKPTSEAVPAMPGWGEIRRACTCDRLSRGPPLACDNADNG